jgi:hypothetical protein
MPRLGGSQHLVAASDIRFDGDRASGRTMCFNPLVDVPAGRPGQRTWFYGLWYRDTFERTDAGWRIVSRYEELLYVHNEPDLGGEASTHHEEPSGS